PGPDAQGPRRERRLAALAPPPRRVRQQVTRTEEGGRPTPLDHAHKPGEVRPRPLPRLRPRDRPAGPLLARAAAGASVRIHRAVGPPRPPVRNMGAVAVW